MHKIRKHLHLFLQVNVSSLGILQELNHELRQDKVENLIIKKDVYFVHYTEEDKSA